MVFVNNNTDTNAVWDRPPHYRGGRTLPTIITSTNREIATPLDRAPAGRPSFFLPSLPSDATNSAQNRFHRVRAAGKARGMRPLRYHHHHRQQQQQQQLLPPRQPTLHHQYNDLYDPVTGGPAAATSPLPPSPALHRNPDAAPYLACTFLNPFDRWVAAIDARGRLDLVHIPNKVPGEEHNHHKSSQPSGSQLLQRVHLTADSSVGCGATISHPGSYHLQSVQNGHALAVGTPTGDFRVLVTERAVATTATTVSTVRPWSKNVVHKGDPASWLSLSGSYWIASRVGRRPQRRYAPSLEWTLRDQAQGLRLDRLWSLEEISHWNVRPNPSSSSTWGMDSPGGWSQCGGGAGFATAPVARGWDFLETPSGLLAAHSGFDYVGVQVLDDRVDRTHVLVLGGDDRENCGDEGRTSGFTAAADAVAFATPDGRLLATRSIASSGCDDSPVLLWDLRHTRRPSSALTKTSSAVVVLPSFPRDTAHCLDAPLDAWWGTDVVGTRRQGQRYSAPRGRTIELPALEQRTDDWEVANVYDDSVVDDDCGTRLVSLSAADCALLWHKLHQRSTSGSPPRALHRDGWVVGPDSFSTTTDPTTVLRAWDAEHTVREIQPPSRRRRPQKNTTGTKRALDGTLRQMFDVDEGRKETGNGGSAKHYPRATTTTDGDGKRQHHRHDDAAAAALWTLPVRLEDRYGCATSLSCLAFDETGSRLVGGTCDGDLFVFGSK